MAAAMLGLMHTRAPHAALLMDFLNTEEKRQRRMVHLPMGRFGEAIEVAKGALFCAYPPSLYSLRLTRVG